MTTTAVGSQATSGPSSSAGQIVAWVVLLFSLTVIGGLPMLLQGVIASGWGCRGRRLSRA